MSDPFDRLRDSAPDTAPDIGAIRGRARRIERNQRLLLGGSAAGVAALAVIAILVSTSPQPANDLSSRALGATPTPEVVPGAVGAVTSDSTLDSGAQEGTKEKAESGSVSGASGLAPSNATTGGGDAASAESAPVEDTLKATIEVEGSVLGGGAFTITACNPTKETQTRTFPDAQRYDFTVEREDGTKVWTWSDGRTFAQVVAKETWKPDECKSWSDSWDGTDSKGNRVPNGKYGVSGVVTLNPPLPGQETHTFCSGVCS